MLSTEKETLENSSRLKENQEAWQLNAMYGLGLDRSPQGAVFELALCPVCASTAVAFSKLRWRITL